MKLLIVESPGKIKTLRQILGSGWQIEASIGHTTELAHSGPKRLGFEFNQGKVITHYEPRGTRGKEVLAKLRRAAKQADTVYLATDPDREGEAIAWHLVEQLELKNYYRVTYTQITPSAVQQAIAHPGSLNRDLISSQRARQCLDKLVGYEVSPLLWHSTGGKSAGRVQSATLHLICERERERLAFIPEQYFVLRSYYKEGFESLFWLPTGGDSSDIESANRIKTRSEAELVAEVAKQEAHIVKSNDKKIEKRNPPPPFITSSLQQMAGVRFKFAPKKTMQIAQELYEGIQGKGLITYMRTDAVTLSTEFVAESRAWLKQNYPNVLPEKAPFYRTQSDAQAAHEAIRPTSVEMTPEQAKRILTPDQLKLYSMIWERSIACQCKPATLSKSEIRIEAGSTNWISRGMTLVDPGYLIFWKNLEDEKQLPVVHLGQKLGFEKVEIDERVTAPPPRYSEPKLVQLMEKKGIGRPSTYASTLATLKERDYVILEKQTLIPTPLGMATDAALEKALPELINVTFTAKMEESLDQIAEGKLLWEKYLNQWNSDFFVPALVRAKAALKDVSRVNTTERSPRESGSFQPKQNSPVRHRPSRRTPTPAPLQTLDQHDTENAPTCPNGHGKMQLRLSKKKTKYWKCAASGCERFSWFVEYSSQSCPNCGAKMEKIKSKKVTGGYFLKCTLKEKHSEEVVLFKNKLTKQWVVARS